MYNNGIIKEQEFKKKKNFFYLGVKKTFLKKSDFKLFIFYLGTAD